MKRSEKKELKKLMNRKEWKEWKRQHNRIDHSSWEERIRQLDMSSLAEEEIGKAEKELNSAQRNARRRVTGGVLLLVVAFIGLMVGFKFR
jgi:ferric-dicitrate binding protein FerR (iron transport regulator)